MTEAANLWLSHTGEASAGSVRNMFCRNMHAFKFSSSIFFFQLVALGRGEKFSDVQDVEKCGQIS